MSVNLPRNRVEASSAPLSPPQPSVKIWLPRDRKTVDHIINIYFKRLNYHRPALDQVDFERNLKALYEGHITVHHDQGFICMMYLVLALGTLNDVNHSANELESDGDTPASSPTIKKKIMPDGWPDHGEFFDWGLFYKPEIQATISALQALILLHWYLYTEVCSRHKSWDDVSISDFDLATRSYPLAPGWWFSPPCSGAWSASRSLCARYIHRGGMPATCTPMGHSHGARSGYVSVVGSTTWYCAVRLQHVSAFSV